MTNLHDNKFLLAVAAFVKFGPIKLGRLNSFFHSDWERVFNASSTDLTKAGIEESVANEFISFRQNINPEKIVEALQKEDINLCLFSDTDYPRLLKQIINPPLFLYYRGDISVATDLSIAVVGSRKCSPYGRIATEKLTTDLVKAGLTIVSGLALGIDTFAHETTLKNKGKTVAVLGCGLDWASLYPPTNRRLAENIIANGGAIISEFPLGMAPLRFNFPQRNRIVSGMTRGTLVIEANEKSGALITADYALEQNREVFALPGNIFSLSSAGPNNLIKKGATPITCANDVLETLNLERIDYIKINRELLPKTPDEQAILDILSHEPIHLNEIVRLTRLDTSVINSTLTIMEMKGLVKSASNMKYIIAS